MSAPAASGTVATRILGIDPGLRNTGFGVIDTLGSQLRYVASGVIRSGEGSLPVTLPFQALLKPATTGYDNTTMTLIDSAAT